MEKTDEKSRRIALQFWSRALVLVFLDVVLISVSYFMALILRVDFIFSNIPREYIQGFIWSLP